MVSKGQVMEWRVLLQLLQILLLTVSMSYIRLSCQLQDPTCCCITLDQNISDERLCLLTGKYEFSVHSVSTNSGFLHQSRTTNLNKVTFYK